MRLRVLLSPSEVSSAMEAINNLSPPPFFLPAHCVFSASLSVPLGRVLFQKQIRVVRVGLRLYSKDHNHKGLFFPAVKNSRITVKETKILSEAI